MVSEAACVCVCVCVRARAHQVAMFNKILFPVFVWNMKYGLFTRASVELTKSNACACQLELR